MHFKHLTFVVIGVVFSLLMLGNIGQFGATAANSKTTVDYWTWLDDPSNPAFYEMMEDFRETHPGIKLKVQVIPWDSFHQKLMISIAAGVYPNASEIHINWLAELLKMGVLQPLDEYIEKWPGASDVREEIWDLEKIQGVEEKYVIPARDTVALYLYYRKDWFQQEGLAVPTNYKEFLESAKVLTKDTDGDGRIDQWGYGMRGARGGHDMWNTFVKFFNRDGSINTDKAAVVKATKWYADLFRKWKVCPPSAPSDGFVQFTTDFRNDVTAMIIHHIGSSQGMIKALGNKVAAAAVPEGMNGGYTSAVPGQNGILKGASKEKEKAAFEFISWFGEHKQVDRWCKSYGSVPILNSVAKLPFYQKDPFQKATIETMKYAGHLPYVPETGPFIEYVWPTIFGRLLLSEITAEEAIETFYKHYKVTLK